ncbi:MAG: prepilin-type N-terminal cleavage/methylation domain-containing protein [Terracidiphilus sp.]
MPRSFVAAPTRLWTDMKCSNLLSRHSNARAARANGFTLMELLIVMAIIAILMLIGIPTTRSLMKQSHELSAKKSLQTIQQVEQMYADRYPSKGFACNLSYLGGDTSQGAPSATSAQMIPDDLAKGNKSGYNFAITNCQKSTQDGSERVVSYTVTAVPESLNKTGDRGFCTDDGGVLKQDPTGGANCTETVR